MKTSVGVKRCVHVTLSGQKIVADFHEKTANDSAAPRDEDRKRPVFHPYLIGRCYHEPRPELITETILLQRLYIID